MSALKTNSININWKGAPSLKWSKTVNLTNTISVKKACTNCFLEVNSPRQKNLGSIVVTWCFLMFGSSLQKKYRKIINKPSKKKTHNILALLEDDLQNCDNQIQAIQYENVVVVASLFYFGKNCTVVIDLILFTMFI